MAVAISGTGNRVMTSPDGINWTSRASAADNTWLAVTYGDGLFVATATSGTGDRVMTSPDGINWTIGSSAADNSWSNVIYANGLFVAVAYSGTGNRVMTSSCDNSPIGIGSVSATYGYNCASVVDGNATSLVSSACDGGTTCSFTVNNTWFGSDPEYGCAKKFAVEYGCSSPASKSQTNLNEGTGVTLTCP